MNTKNLTNKCQQEKFPIPFEILLKKRKIVVLFLTDKVDKKTLLDVLHERHQGTCKAIMSYQVGKEHPKNLPHHQSIFEKLNASKDRKFVINMNGSHGPSGFDGNKGQRLLTP